MQESLEINCWFLKILFNYLKKFLYRWKNKRLQYIIVYFLKSTSQNILHLTTYIKCMYLYYLLLSYHWFVNMFIKIWPNYVINFYLWWKNITNKLSLDFSIISALSSTIPTQKAFWCFHHFHCFDFTNTNARSYCFITLFKNLLFFRIL